MVNKKIAWLIKRECVRCKLVFFKSSKKQRICEKCKLPSGGGKHAPKKYAAWELYKIGRARWIF